MRPTILSHSSREFAHEHATHQLDGVSLLGSIVLLAFAIGISVATCGQLWSTLKGRNTRFR